MHYFCTFFGFMCTITGKTMKRIAIFASGEGTNAERIIRYFEGNKAVEIMLVVTNKEQAGVIRRAENLKVPAMYLPAKDFKEGKINEVMRQHQIDFIVLAGFLLHVPDSLLKDYPNRIINIHPSLLPKFGGKGMYGSRVHEAVLAAGEQESGITIHYVNEHYDQGAIILQAKCPVLPDDTPETLASRVHQLEYEHFPVAIENLL
jgi:phosphoribosylglycinamide formyltransferase-1